MVPCHSLGVVGQRKVPHVFLHALSNKMFDTTVVESIPKILVDSNIHKFTLLKSCFSKNPRKVFKKLEISIYCLADMPISFDFITIANDLQTKKLVLYGLLWLQFPKPFIAYEIMNSREKIDILTILPYTPFGIIWELSSHLKRFAAVNRLKDGILKRKKSAVSFWSNIQKQNRLG